MEHPLTISEARRKLPSLLKALQKDASLSFLIKVREEPVATLASTKRVSKEGQAVKALLRLMKSSKKRPIKSEVSVSSENFKNFLYA